MRTDWLGRFTTCPFFYLDRVSITVYTVHIKERYTVYTVIKIQDAFAT